MTNIKKFKNRNTVLLCGSIAKKFPGDKQLSKEIYNCLKRYENNDFGNLTYEDIQANLNGIKSNLKRDRVLARYELKNGKDIYIITELYQREGFDIITSIMYVEDY